MHSLIGHYRNQCVLQVPHSEDALRHLDGQICTINNTKGDGACGVHAAVGTFTAGQYVCADARTFLFQTYGETSAIFLERLGDTQIAQDLENVLWQDLLKPCAAQRAGISHDRYRVREEGTKIWHLVTTTQPQIAELCVSAVRAEHDAYERFTSARLDVVDAFGNLCIRPLEDIFIRPLLMYLGLLDDFCGAMAAVERSEPQISKFEALFIHCSQTTRLRRSVVEYCGAENFHRLLAKVTETVGHMEWTPVAQPVFAFCELLDGIRNVSAPPMAQPFPRFFERIYPSYLGGMMDEGYYLSDVELVALCKCLHTNVVIFKRNMALSLIHI